MAIFFNLISNIFSLLIWSCFPCLCLVLLLVFYCHVTLFYLFSCIWLRTLWTGKILLLWFTHWLYQMWIIVIPYSLGSPMSSWRRFSLSWIEQQGLYSTCPPRVPTTSSLIELHWLLLKARIEFKICFITFKALKFNQPSYIRELSSLPPMNPPWVCEVQMTLTVYMDLELLERGICQLLVFLHCPAFI